MDIEGLTIKSEPSGVVVYFPAGGKGYRHISLAVSGTNATVSYREGKTLPGLQPGEQVVIANWNEQLAERVVRALASLHLGVFEAENAYTACDLAMIERGFQIGISDQGSHVWLNSAGPYYRFITKNAEGGLPSLMDEPCQMIHGVQGGSRAIVQADNMNTLLEVLDTGNLPPVMPFPGVETLVLRRGSAKVH